MKRNFIVKIIAWFFILLFLYTGAIKLMEISQFKDQLASSPLLGPIAGFVTWALPIGEILLAIMLFIPALRLKGLYLSAGLMMLFTGYVAVILVMDNHLSCSCGGIVEELSPKQHLLFNGTCIILSLVGIWIARKTQANIRLQWMAATSTICLLLVVGWTLFSAFTAPAKIKTGLEGRLLPSFKVLLPDSSTYLNTADIPTGKPLIFIGFSPICTHCQKETRDIIDHIDEFKNTNIYLVTNFPFKDMKVYYQYFHLDKYPNITIGVDVKDYFFSYFKAPGVPYTVVYDSKKRLKQAMTGKFNASELAQTAME